MQITPQAWKAVEKEKDFYKTAFNPEANIEAGIKYGLHIDDYCRTWYPNWGKLSDSEKRRIIAAGYNAGIGSLRLKNWDMNRIPDTTKRYVKDIERNLERFNIFN